MKLESSGDYNLFTFSAAKQLFDLPGFSLKVELLTCSVDESLSWVHTLTCTHLPSCVQQ